jgi:hypothetical protein
VDNEGGKCMGKQLDCTTSIARSRNNGIDGNLFRQQTTFSWLSRLASKRKLELSSISGEDWTTTKSNHSNQHVPNNSSSLNSNARSVMIVGLKIIYLSLEPYTTGIFSNVSTSFWHISNVRRTSILNRCASLTLRVVESTER